MLNVIGMTDALILDIETGSSTSLTRWSSNGLRATRSLTSTSANNSLILAVDVVRLVWATFAVSSNGNA